MKAAFSAEAIGFSEQYEEVRGGILAGWIVPPRMPWVAEITGTDPRYGLARSFLRRKADYRDSNRKGTRGVMFWWTLESGHVYETRYRVTRDKWVHRFLSVDEDGNIADLAEEEARQWASGISAPTS